MLAHVIVLRDKQTTVVNVYNLLVRGIDTSDNIDLKPGDMVIVPFNTQHITVLGAVGAPGQYALDQTGTTPEGPERLSDAIGKAGGATNSGAAIKSVAVIRQVASGQSPQIQRFDYGRYLHDGDMAQNPVLQDNDVIVVPAANHPFKLEDVLSYVSYYALFHQLFP
jgi:protein involved in polysaccharide export with SLBB domain